MDTELDFSPMPDEAAMAHLAYSRWERAEAESLAEYVYRRRTVDLALLARQVINEELTAAERRVIQMRYDDNLLPIEISRRLQIHKGTVCHTLQRAEERVRRYLQYVVQYQYNLRHVPFLPLVVREALVVSGARFGKAEDLAARLTALRKGENLTQQAVARGTQISVSRLCVLESGAQIPDADELLRLSTFYAVSADAILKGESSCRA